MRRRDTVATLIFFTSFALAACDRDPPEEEILEEAQETVEQVNQTTLDVVPVPVPVPVAVDTTVRADTADTTLVQ